MFTTVEYTLPCDLIRSKFEVDLHSENPRKYLAGKILTNQLATLSQISYGNVYRIDYITSTKEQRVTLAFFDDEDLPDGLDKIPGVVINSLKNIKISASNA